VEKSDNFRQIFQPAPESDQWFSSDSSGRPDNEVELPSSGASIGEGSDTPMDQFGIWLLLTVAGVGLGCLRLWSDQKTRTSLDAIRRSLEKR
jgi:hypothetical protein